MTFWHCVAGETTGGETATGETVTSVTSVYCNEHCVFVTVSGSIGSTAAFTASNKLQSDGTNTCCIVHIADIVTEIVHTPVTNSTSSSKHSKYKARSSSSTGHSGNVTTRQYIVTTLRSCHMLSNDTATHSKASTVATTAAVAQPMDVDTAHKVSNTQLLHLQRISIKQRL
jgi:hypothetical protein